MSGAGGAAEVVAALRALYASPDPAQRSNANLWLIHFQSTPAAWSVSIELLSSSEGLEAQHFAAQTLHAVISRQWENVPPVDQAASALVPLLLRFANGPAIVLTKLCLALAALTVRVIPQGWPSCFADVMRVVQGDQGQGAAAAVGATVLQYFALLPEEYEGMVCTQARRDAVKAEFAKGTPALCGLAEAALRRGPDGEPATAALQRSALRCMQTWLPFLPASFTYRGWLLDAALAALAAPPLCAAAAELLADAFAALPPSEANGVFAAASPRLAAAAGVLQSGEAAAAEAVCRVTVALVDACNEALVRADEQASAVVKVLLQCTGHASRRVSALTLEAWCGLERSVAESGSAKAYGPVYRALVEALVRACAYPPDERDGEADEAREDDPSAPGEDLAAYRREAGDALASSFRLLRGDYFEPLLAALAAAPREPWQTTEALLLAVQEVADYVCDAASALPEATHARLEALFAAAAAPADPAEPRRLKRRRLALLGAYAEWVQGRPAVAPVAVAALLAGLAEGPLSVAAARAVRALCRDSTRANAYMAGTVFPALEAAWARTHPAAAAPLPPDPAALAEVRPLLAEALARLAQYNPAAAVHAPLPAPAPDPACGAGAAPAGRILAALAGRVAAAAGRGDERALVSELASAEAAAIVLEGAEPAAAAQPLAALLAALAAALDPACPPAACEAACGALQRAFAVGRPELMAGAAGAAGEALAAAFLARGAPCALETLALALAKYPAAPGWTAALDAAVARCVQAALGALHTAPDLPAALFRLAAEATRARPAALGGAAAVFEAGLGLLCAQERETARAALDFFTQFLTAAALPGAAGEGARGVLAGLGGRLVAGLLAAVAGAMPSTMVGALADLLALAFDAFPAGRAPWAAAAADALPAECRQQALALLTSAPLLANRRRFRAMVTDLSRICRSQMTPDALLAYQMS